MVTLDLGQNLSAHSGQDQTVAGGSGLSFISQLVQSLSCVQLFVTPWTAAN